MADIAATIIIFSICMIILIAILSGAAMILSRNFWLGIIFLIFLTPLFLLWAFFEGIFGN